MLIFTIYDEKINENMCLCKMRNEIKLANSKGCKKNIGMMTRLNKIEINERVE